MELEKTSAVEVETKMDYSTLGGAYLALQCSASLAFNAGKLNKDYLHLLQLLRPKNLVL